MWLFYPTILPELVKRGTDDLGSATIRLVPAFLRAVPPDHLARGGARKRESRERRTRDLLGISDLPGARSMGFGFRVDRSCISPIKN